MRAVLDRVDDRDRAIVAMRLQRTHPDDIAKTLGISARALERRRQSLLKRLTDTPARHDPRAGELSLSSRLNSQERPESRVGPAHAPELVSMIRRA